MDPFAQAEMIAMEEEAATNLLSDRMSALELDVRQRLRVESGGVFVERVRIVDNGAWVRVFAEVNGEVLGGLGDVLEEAVESCSREVEASA